MEWAYLIFNDTRFERLANISVSHLYNLRAGRAYQNKRQHGTKIRPTAVPIGQRRAPQPDGVPGYIRIDSVHQGDQDGKKGVYHITQSTAWPNFNLSLLAIGLVRRICCRLSSSYLISSRSPCWVVTLIMAQNTSTTKLPGYWKAAHRIHQVTTTIFQGECFGGIQKRCRCA